MRTGFLIIFLLPLALFAGQQKLDPRLTQFALDHAVVESRSDFLKKSDVGVMLRVVITVQGDVNEIRAAGAKIICRRGNIVVADIPASSLDRLSELPAVLYIEAPFPDKMQLDKSTVAIHAVSARMQSGLSGRGVIVGIIDSGIDWKHPDFRTASGETRIQYLLDLSQAGPVYGGMLYTASKINDALFGDGVVDSDDISGHGSHVAGIAAGDGSETAVFGTYAGVAPAADLVVVKATRDQEGKEFLIADQMIALSFIDSVAQLAGKPYVANLSFGGHNGAHDGTSATERFIDALVGPGISGKAVVTVAGNDGDNAVHSQVAVNSGGSFVSFNVGRYTPYPGSNNDLIVISGWYDGAQRIGVKLKTP
ncbi:MAG: hypothetical protein EHM72_19835, partial [Calditrichaeota bacterium]